MYFRIYFTKFHSASSLKNFSNIHIKIILMRIVMLEYPVIISAANLSMDS